MLVKFYSDPGILDADVAQEYKIITKSTLMRNFKSLHQRLFKQKETNSDGDSSTSSATTQDSMSTPAGADYNPIPLAKELSDLLKGSHSTTVARSDTLAREIALFTTNRQETDAIKEIRRALFVVESERVF